MSTTAARIRELAATGLSAEAIGKQLGVKPVRVTQTLQRRACMGRPGGQAPLDIQIQYAKRVADSTEDEVARELAARLLERLLSLR
jgi:IS30 family transposase